MVQIPRNFCLRHLIQLNHSNAYHVIGKNAKDLVIYRLRTKYQTNQLKKLLVTYNATGVAVNAGSAPIFIVNQTSVSTVLSSRIDSLDVLKLKSTLVAEVVILNEMTIHESKKDAIDIFFKLIKEYPKVWVNTGFANFPKDNQMKILLKLDQKSKISRNAKVYSLGARDKRLVNKTFDKL